MFKIESYITPILLSYVDKYIKNFRLEDSTVSLWGGDACFHNLDLRLEVLEQELQLPVSFVSGHIRELLIHVPWTKLASEPITITINTIECILKLRGSDASSTSSSSREKPKTQSQDLEAPPGYLSSLIHKIVANIRIYCNNLILKYVEEDIVLSMNIKHFKFESANELWESSFTDLASDEVKMRKLICINDLTICLDKRNAAGKIEIYQEPMLYKCSMTMHLLRTYHSASASRTSTTRLDIYCNSLEFGMSEQQLPMLIRLVLLIYALKKKKIEDDHEPSVISSVTSEMRETVDASYTWGGWAWSYVSSVLSEPTNEEWLNQQNSDKGHILQVGFYIDKASVIFKVTDASRDRNYFAHKKLRYMPVLALELQGLYSETVIQGPKWLNSSFGISEILLSPLGHCSCSAMETPEGCKPIPYLRIGNQSNYYKFNSLFDADALENKGAKKFYNNCWDYHLINLTESVLLERTPALAVDYIHEMAIPDDITPEKLSELSSNFEYSNLPERDYTRIFVAPLKLRVCSGLYHRLSSMVMAAMTYEYVPYYVPTPDPDLQDLLPPSEEDFDALTEFIPLASVKITFFGPVIEFETADHQHFVPRKGKLYRRHKKISQTQQTTSDIPQMEVEKTKLIIEFQCLDLLYITPFYVNRLICTTCQLPDPPRALFDACFKKIELKVLGLTSRLVLNPKCHTTVLVPFNASFMTRQILKPKYWLNPDIIHFEMTVESENFTMNGTKAKMLVIHDIITGLFQLDADDNTLLNSSVLLDAANDEGFPYMELYIEGIRFKHVNTCTTVSMDMSLESVRAFIFETSINEKLVQREGTVPKLKRFSNKNIQQILFISGPEPKDGTSNSNGSTQETPLFTATIQYPLDPDVQVHPTIVTYNIQEIRICVDPLVFKWFLYQPQFYKSSTFANFSDVSYKIKSTDSSLFYEPSKKTSAHLESVHSSSDRDRSSVISKRSKIVKEEPVDMQERIYNFLRDWFGVWKCMIVSGEISQCTIYFPMVSLSAVGSQGIQEAVDQAMHKKDPPDIMVITLPFLSTHCTQRQKLAKYITHLPVKLPESIWSSDRSCFPWTLSIKDLSCYTIQNGQKMDCLKPCSLNATIGLSTRNSKPENTEAGQDSSSMCLVKNDISSLGVCVHVDMTPLFISTCEVQVYLFAGILYGLVEVASNLMPCEKPKPQEYPTRILESIDSRSGSVLMLPELSLDHQSQHSSSVHLPEIAEQDAKLTAWLQWTVTRFTIELNSMTKEWKKNKPKLKLVVDMEDLVSSIDFQNVYLKIKSKIGSISIEHFKFIKDKWQPGPFTGLVLRHRDDYLNEDRLEDNAFINLTITRASCQHTHTLWGTLHNKKDFKTSSAISPTRYITEIVVTIKPTDLLLSFKTLRNFYLVLEPLFGIQFPVKRGPQSASTSYITNQILPLAYLECHDVRVIMPVSSLKKKHTPKIEHDVYVFQVVKISLQPNAVNPICRTPYRPDIYQYAARNGILNIPGSELEDRQYQLDIVGTSLNTGTWKNVELILNQPTGILTTLHGSSENPAVEWNNLEKISINSINPSMHLRTVFEKIDVSIVAAPAMVYKEVLVCCNSVETNIVSDIFVSLSLSQIKLALYLIGEFNELIVPVKTVKSKIEFPYPKLADSREDSDLEFFKDSGIESSEFKSVGSSLKPDSIYRLDSEKLASSKTSTSIETNNPFELLLTGGKISLSLYTSGVHYPTHNRTKHAKEEAQSFKRKEKVKNPLKYGKDLLKVLNPERIKTGLVPFTSSKIRFLKTKTGSDQKMKTSDSTNFTEEMMHEEEIEKYFIPLLFITLSQPNLYLLDQKNNRKVHFCVFNVGARITGVEHAPIKSIPMAEDYQLSLLETLSGEPHPDSGIPPAFVTVKTVTNSSNYTNLEVNFARPTRLGFSTQICHDILAIHQELSDCVKSESSRSVPLAKTKLSAGNLPLTLIPESTENYVQFQKIKDRVFNINSINIETQQLVVVWATDIEYKLKLVVGRTKNNFSLAHRPDKVCNFLHLECISLIYENESISRLVLNPWTLSLDISLFWESWQYVGDGPQVQIIAESECLMITICPERIETLQIVLSDFMKFLSDFRGSIEQEHIPKEEPVKSCQDSEQHYKDDLRAGAFQFVDSTTNNIDEMPLPYQVMFWNKNIAAMAWRYPQPRSLTKVRVFPVPLKIIAVEPEQEIQITCSLEYWSECHASFISFTEFVLPENEILELELPTGRPYPPFACVWRVELSISNQNIDIFSTFSPRALAACMRIDSYFNRNLIPDFNIAFTINRLHLALHTLYDKEKYTVLPVFLKGYVPDKMFPDSHCFSEIIFDNLKLYGSSLNLGVYMIDMTTSFKLNVLEYTFLTMQPMIESFGSRFEMSIAKTCKSHFISKSIAVNFSPSIAHTLAVSTQLWNQNYLRFFREKDKELDFIIVTRYVICNDTNLAIKFGQNNTDEEIILMPKYFHLYCWRSQKHRQQLRISLESKGWLWSDPFSLKLGNQIIEVSAKKKMTLNLTVVAVSATQYQVIISGHLVISNMLLEHFELKIIQESVSENKKIINQVVAGSSMTTSIVINYEKSYFLRLRFYGLDTSWTGDIPLMEHSKSVQPWLVKVPLLEKGQFLSIWCRVVVQEFTNGRKILAMLWPLFTIKSNLPISTKVHIETPILNYHGEIMVKGRGISQQLYCPGTIDHSHQLTFQLENVSPGPNPYVPLNYSLINHEDFFKRMDTVNIQNIIEYLKTYNEPNWPYFGEELESVDWLVAEQPETQVQVKYMNSCQYSSSLMVEILPWSLLVNTLGATIGIKVEGVEMCEIQHNGIIAPPKIEENFNIFVYIDNEKFMSDPLQFSKPVTWSQNFYMPKILGIIPEDGTVVSNIMCNKHICRLLIKSIIDNEIRLLKVSSTHVVCNDTGFKLFVMCLSVPHGDVVHSIPHHLECGIIVVNPEVYEKNKGTSITRWYDLGYQTVQNNHVENVYYMAFSLNPILGWSKPLEVDKIFMRKTVSVISALEPVPLAVTCNEHKGQKFVSVHSDTRPQIYLENDCGVTLYCAQPELGEEAGALKECEHFEWFCQIRNGGSNYYSLTSLSDKFPEIPVHSFQENLVFSKDPQGTTWSAPISITNDADQYVKIPFYGDVRIIIKNSSCLTYLKIESVSKMEINAKDIRSRLSQFEKMSPSLRVDDVKPHRDEPMVSSSKSAETISPFKDDNTPVTDFHLSSLGNVYAHMQEQEQEAHQLRKGKSDSQIIISRETKKLLCNTIPMLEKWESLKMIVLVNEFSFTLLSDIDIKSGEVSELAALTCDNLAISTLQSESMHLNLYIQNIQLDNQLYLKKNYDFPVVMLLQEPKNCRKIQSINVPIESLFKEITEDAALKSSIIIDTWIDPRGQKLSGIQELRFSIEPFSCYIEDTYILLFSEYLNVFFPTNLVCIPETHKMVIPVDDESLFVNIPDIILWQSMAQAHPLTIRHLLIEPVSVMLSVHSSIKMYLALDQSPLFFTDFERKRVYTNAYRFGHTLTMHYLSGAIFRAGWMVSSLEILGSPVGLARAMGSGLKDFVALPFRGLLQGPVEFLYGVTHGSASLMKHITAGTLQSFTKMASSVARNLDYLTLDEEHVRRAEEQRRQRPSGVTEGLMQGLTGLGISILGAIGGIAHHPLQSVISEGGSPRSLAAGLGLGLVGIITKPLSGAAELLALTGQGLLQGAGWNNMPEQRSQPVLHNMFSSGSSILKYEWKIIGLNDSYSKVLHMTDATSISSGSQYASVALILTGNNLIIMNADKDLIQNSIPLSELEPVKSNVDPTLLSFELVPMQVMVLKTDDELNVEMDPASRARVADYVKNTVGLLQVTNRSRDPSEMSISPLSSPGGSNDENIKSNTVLSFYVNPQDRNYFLCLLTIAKQENLNSCNNYSVL